MFDPKKALAMGLFIAALLCLTHSANGQLPPPAEEKKGGPPTPLTPASADLKLRPSMEKLKGYLDDNKLQYHYTLNKYAFSVVIPLDKADASWETRVKAEATKAYAEKDASTVKQIVGIVFVSTTGENFQRAVFRYKDAKDSVRTLNVPFGLPAASADTLTDDFVQMSEAEAVLKRFESVVKK